MFTGLIEDVGELVVRRPAGAAAKVVIRTGLPCGDVRVGESIAVNGACLTVESVDVAAGEVSFHCLQETLGRTNLSRVPMGTAVNLERALRLGDRLGGHLVSGHVDATAAIGAIGRRGEDVEVAIEAPPAIRPLLIPKGSIAVNGISLTVASIEGESFRVCIIPHTWQATNLRSARVGDRVNLEGDMVGKYILRWQALRDGEGGSVSEDTLRNAGFL
ncbi:MAG: riboflavin synthase [Lentisphaeria bacterium]|nr:riboflavin synthase [Lentisphaeria bacterium]